MLDGTEFDVDARWQALDRWLVALQPLWRPVPFTTPTPPWAGQWPEFERWLDALDDGEVAHYEHDPDRFAQQAAAWLPQLGRRRGLIAVPALSGPDSTLAEALARDMPGRKRLQAGAMAAALRPFSPAVVDWCCGKGHLARTLAAAGAGSVYGLEWDAALVNEGNRLARDSGAAVTLRRQDVLAPALVWPGADQGVALHACGDLHRQLLTTGVGCGVSRLSVVPCCYHRTAAAEHMPMSRRVNAAHGRCRLSRDDLRLVVQETVTAPGRERRQRHRLSAWRLGFDGLQRTLRGRDEYLPIPSHPTRLNQGDFAGFCRWAAQCKGLELPPQPDFAYWEQHGRSRHARVRRLELVRHLFRRPLELWLVLDYALYLQEQGFAVRLGTFCERALTPRNLLLDAHRQGLR
ncbi:methyltransferase [Marinobacter sp. SS21]|uniref:methyltransferase n=1 Tax=Marinobacter sp. SS21 TaxID=2979460 RepID=UPI00232AC189|nr:methyltransferase [Marinobacter sp. SS21]MDC0662993.1 methyltransferase [Marinobacter sp. SS21]